MRQLKRLQAFKLGLRTIIDSSNKFLPSNDAIRKMFPRARPIFLRYLGAALEEKVDKMDVVSAFRLYQKYETVWFSLSPVESTPSENRNRLA